MHRAGTGEAQAVIHISRCAKGLTGRAGGMAYRLTQTRYRPSFLRRDDAAINPFRTPGEADVTSADPPKDLAETPREAGRLVVLDAARGVALVAMACFHFTYDLQIFGFLPEGTIQAGPWRAFAMLIAGSFLFISGFSLVLAHRRGLRWRAFGRRLAILAGAAGLVSLATWLAMPDRFVHFGILHALAVSSLLGVLVLRLPGAVLLAMAAAVLMLPQVFRHEMFNAPWFWWLGLSTEWPLTMDYEPVFPWFAPFLAGMAAAKWLAARLQIGMVARTGGRQYLLPVLTFLGRHSLVVYLVHQPLLMGLIWAFTRAMP